MIGMAIRDSEDQLIERADAPFDSTVSFTLVYDTFRDSFHGEL